MKDPLNLDIWTDEQLLEKHEELKYKLEELDAESKIIREILLERLDEKKINSQVVGDWTVSKVTMVTFPGVSLDKAKELGATKEAIDNAALKKLYAANALKEGVEVVNYTRIGRVKEKND